MATITEVGTYEAKTHLADFLRKVKAGNAFRITQRGEPVADLIPAGMQEKRHATQAAARMGAFMRGQSVTRDIDVRALIDEGRD